MRNWFFYLSLSSVLVSWLCSLRCFRIGCPRILRQFSFFLLLTFLAEVFGWWWAVGLHRLAGRAQSNQWFYNFFHLGSYLFLAYFFHQLIQHPRIRRLIRGLGLVFLLFALVNLAFFQGLWQLNTYTEIMACFFMVFLSIAYYYQLLHARQVVVLVRDPFFWISTGLLIYYLGSAMGIFLINVMHAVSTGKANSIHVIIRFSALIMYLNFSIAFLCQKRK